MPIFLVDNAFLYDGKDWLAPGACCILGYHGAGHPQGNGAGSTNGNGNQPVQTFIFASWMSNGVFGGGYMCNATFTSCGPSDDVLQDIHALSHEVAEWAGRPVRQQHRAAVGRRRPRSSTDAPTCSRPVTRSSASAGSSRSGGTTYHPEDEVFKSWFARDNPSVAYAGNYTFMGPYNPARFDDYPAPTC